MGMLPLTKQRGENTKKTSRIKEKHPQNLTEAPVIYYKKQWKEQEGKFIKKIDKFDGVSQESFEHNMQHAPEHRSLMASISSAKVEIAVVNLQKDLLVNPPMVIALKDEPGSHKILVCACT